MKVSVTIYSLNQYCRDGRMSVQDFIAFCGDLGVDAVDLGYYWRDSAADLPLVGQWLAPYNLRIGAYIVGNNFAVPPEQLDGQVARVHQAIDDAVAVGASTLRIFVGDAAEDLDYGQARDRVLPPLRTVTDYAATRQVVLAVENHGRLAGRADQIIDILETVNSPFLRANVDIGNWMVVDEDPVTSTRKVAPYAALCHVKDFQRTPDGLVPCVVGEGQVNLVGCFSALAEAGYAGYASIEYEAAGDARVGTRRSVQATQRALAQLQDAR